MKIFYIHQKIKLVVNQYLVYAADDAGNEGELVAFVHQKRFALKEKLTFYSDESKQEVSFEVQARQVIDFGARYDIKDSDGQLLGTIGKAFGASLLRSTWHIFAPGHEDSPALIVRERSQALAIVRRVWEILPYIGDIPFFAKYHFDFTDPDSDKVLATYNKTTLFRDHYKLAIKDEALNKFDERVFIAQGVMLDALQSR